jgi:hypothetical protein
VHALRKIHTALAPDGLLVDTQPVSAHPRVAADGTALGALDMRDWLATIRAVDERLAETVGAGLYNAQLERRFIVTDSFGDGTECLEVVSNWRGTRVRPSLASQLEATRSTVTVEQEVRLRLLRRTTPKRS